MCEYQELCWHFEMIINEAFTCRLYNSISETEIYTPIEQSVIRI